MAKLGEYNKLVQDFEEIADFVTVYTSEAHPLDEWAIFHETYKRNQHCSMADRISAANVLKAEGILGNLVVESMANEAEELYASLPERLVVVVDGVVKFKGGLGPFGYQPEAVRTWLRKWTKRNTTYNV